MGLMGLVGRLPPPLLLLLLLGRGGVVTGVVADGGVWVVFAWISVAGMVSGGMDAALLGRNDGDETANGDDRRSKLLRSLVSGRDWAWAGAIGRSLNTRALALLPTLRREVRNFANFWLFTAELANT